MIPSTSEYVMHHRWINNEWGKPTKCECNICPGTGKRLEWALKHGRTHSDNRNDYMQLCTKCHRWYDKNDPNRITRDNNPMFKKGRVFSEETREKLRQAKLGVKRKPFSDETRRRMSIAASRPRKKQA